MSKKRFVIFKDHIRGSYIRIWENKVIRVKGCIPFVKAEVPEEDTGERNVMAIKNLTNRPGEC